MLCTSFNLLILTSFNWKWLIVRWVRLHRWILSASNTVFCFDSCLLSRGNWRAEQFRSTSNTVSKPCRVCPSLNLFEGSHSVSLFLHYWFHQTHYMHCFKSKINEGGCESVERAVVECGASQRGVQQAAEHVIKKNECHSEDSAHHLFIRPESSPSFS